MANLLILNGPNLNLLGEREQKIYGETSLDTINKNLQSIATKLGHQLHNIQSNAEHQLIEAIQQAKSTIEFIIINPAAFTHTSVALRDALLAVKIPFIEIHLSNIQSREEFRKHSYFSDIALGVIQGFGAYGYELALQAAHQYLQTS